MKPNPKTRRTAAAWAAVVSIAVPALYFAIAPWVALVVLKSGEPGSKFFEMVFAPVGFVYEEIGFYKRYVDWCLGY